MNPHANEYKRPVNIYRPLFIPNLFDDDVTAHAARVAREGAHEGMWRSFDGGHVQGEAGRFATAQKFGFGEHALIAHFHIVCRWACFQAVFNHRVQIAGFGDDNIVAHRRFGHAACVFEVDGELLTACGYGDFFAAELHRIVAA